MISKNQIKILIKLIFGAFIITSVIYVFYIIIKAMFPSWETSGLCSSAFASLFMLSGIIFGIIYFSYKKRIYTSSESSRSEISNDE
jgi:hypothetical protein